LIQIYAKLKCTEYRIRGKISDRLQRVKAIESPILLKDFNAHVGNDVGEWKGVISEHADADIL